jgi:hypothetical protein
MPENKNTAKEAATATNMASATQNSAAPIRSVVRIPNIATFMTAILLSLVFGVLGGLLYMGERSRINIYGGIPAAAKQSAEAINLNASDADYIFKELKSAGCKTVKKIAFADDYIKNNQKAGWAFYVTTYFNNEYLLYMSYEKIIIRITKL